MDLEQPTTQLNPDPDKKTKEINNVTGNHSDTYINGMSNGYDRKKEHKSEHKDKDKEKSHKSDHKDKERSKEKDKNHKSEHREKDKDKHKHSSSSVKDKDKHDSSNSSKDKDKDKKSSSSSSKEKEHKSSSSSSKDKEKDKHKDREHHHKSSSSSSSKDKERHHSSSKDKESSSKDKDKSKDRDKNKHKHSLSSSSRDKDKDKSVSKDKEKEKKHSSEKDKERHSTSHSNDKEKHRSSDKDKDKDKHSLSSKDKHRHDKDKDRHRHDKEKSKHKEEKDRKDKEKEDIKMNEEVVDVKPNHVQASEFNFIDIPVKHEVKEEPVSQIEPEDDDDSGGEQPLYIKEEEDEEEPANEDASMDSSDGNDTRLSDLHNTTIKTEEESDEDMPLSTRSKPNTTSKRRIYSDDEEEDVPLVVRKKSKKTETKAQIKKPKYEDEEEQVEQKPKKKRSRTSKGDNTSPRKKKQEEEQEVWKWWEEEKKNDGTKWTFLEHKGPVFAPSYEPLPPNVKFYYNGKEMKLSQDTEEVATFYARMLDHDYTTKPAFNSNFFHDWREVMTESERSKISDLNKCNFKEMHTYFLQKSEERKAMTKDEKQKIKEQNEEIQKEYGFCTIDGHKEKIGNFKIEPPGLFRGRGEHPKMGKLKKRVMPEDILINCSKDSCIPKPPSGHKWKEIRHDPNVTWLASWTENVQGQVKYVMLNPSSKLKGEKDWQKYETARKLAQSIDKIRAEYREDWKSKEMRIRQRAVALYFIDKLALRAGNEKDEDQADTVGCCSLRVEHITLHEQKDGKEYVVVFDFLGKDSIRYYNEVPVEKRVFKNLQLFMENKSPGDDLFDRLNTTVMNKHLNELMEGLTAKVFRTYNASWTLQQQLDKLTNPDDTIAEKILSYNRANRAVAILCNHQRSVPKTHAKSMENLKAKIEAKKEAITDAELAVKDAKREAKHGSVKEKVVYEKKKKTLDRLREQLTKLEVQATDKEENKEIALGTSKLNYLDPRISVAWCKKNDVPIDKIYNKTQRDKFRWAIDMAGPDYVF
ncbi:PREDICTED: DNA topoisomerase I, mitochondrial isoform X1 [Dufourea novaeangliae]|uniref:DNA topoisomerase I n=2 Tax=Dufourea novaeangliae TaxID=178035 RepID=A0A154P4U2_DUFNO|nr:PREDICTED: DNA topoisomerase I, mitochondrial isoform X1 [Dufourea novaeangliae]KZC06891.1 DNA topoisomerase 1 [Dufourea novaeangliae]